MLEHGPDVKSSLWREADRVNLQGTVRLPESESPFVVGDSECAVIPAVPVP